MNNLFLFIFVYLFIGGLLIGFTQNNEFEKCGYPQKIETEAVIGALIWPAMIGSAIAVKEDALLITECDSKGIKL